MLIRSPGRLARLSTLAVAAGCCLLSAVPVRAQSDAPAEQVVVTAARRAQPLSRVLADMSVLERDAIERSGASCAAELLAELPGIEFASNGGPAGTTSVFIRGAEMRHVAVYIDGLRVDAQTVGGAPWELIPIDLIERVEVLRGPAAAVYGSDAMTAVVQFFTRRGDQGARSSASLSVGGHDTVRGRLATSGEAAGIDYALAASHGRSQGFNARRIASANPDDDGWRRSGLHASLGAQLAPGHRVEAGLQATNLRAQYDGFNAADDDVSTQTLRTANLSWQGRWSAESSSRVQWGESRNTYESQPSYYRTETTLRNLLLQLERQVGDQHWSLSLERREDRLLNPATTYTGELSSRRTQDAVAVGWRGEFGEQALQAHLRQDHDSEFGGQPTGSLAWGWQLTPRWHLRASAATSFRAPTLYQSFSEYGPDTSPPLNAPELRPEKGRNLELGLRWSEGATEFSATAWHQRVRDLIGFGDAGTCASSFGCYENVNRAQYKGLTLAGRGRMAGASVHGSIDWHDPRNLDTDKLLARRARVLATLGLDTAWAGWGVGASMRGAGPRFDDAANRQRMGSYAVLNLRASRALAPGLTLDLRLDNLTNKDYELARTYPTGGRTATLGVRWSAL